MGLLEGSGSINKIQMQEHLLEKAGSGAGKGSAECPGWRKPTSASRLLLGESLKMLRVYDRAPSPVGKPSAFVRHHWSLEAVPAPLTGRCVVGTTVFPGQYSALRFITPLPWEQGCLGWLRHGFRINPPSGQLPGPSLGSLLSECGKSWLDGTFLSPASSARS